MKEIIKNVNILKEPFIEQVFEAMRSGSIEQYKEFLFSYEVHKQLLGEYAEETSRDFEKQMTRECEAFLENNKRFLDEYKHLFTLENIKTCTISKIDEKEDKHSSLPLRFIGLIEIILKDEKIKIKMHGGEIDEGVMHVKLHINNSVLINDSIKMGAPFIHIYRPTTVENKNIPSLETLGFKKISRDTYLDIMRNESFGYVDEFAKNLWLVYEGNLTISPQQVPLFSGLSLLVKGNFTVNGVFDYQDISSLFVLGNVKAKSILLNSTTCFFSKTTYFDDALIIMGGSGAVVEINSAEGPFVYTDSDAAEINVSNKKIKVCVDYSYDNSFGDAKAILKEQFFEQDDEYLNVDSDNLCRSILKNEDIFKANAIL